MITFLQPHYLWGLLTLLIPIILHLIQYFRPKTVPFSHVRFLKEIYRESQRRLRLKQWLILLFRMGIIAFITLMLAHPVWKEEANAFTVNSSVVLLLDDSPSMNRGVVEEGLFHIAQHTAEKIIRSYSPETKFLILPFSQLTFNRPFIRQKEALEYLYNLHTTYVTGPSLKTILKRLKHLQPPTSGPLHIYLISDFQKSQFQLDSLKGDSIQFSGLMNGIHVGTSSFEENVGILHASIENFVIEPFGPINLQVELLNNTQQDLDTVSVQVNYNGNLGGIATATIPKGTSKKTLVSFIPEKTGWITGAIEIEHDLFSLDDQFYFAFYLKEKPKVIILYKEQLPTGLRIFFSKVISKIFQSEFLRWEELTPEHLQEADILLIAEEGEWEPTLLANLKQWLQEGHGILYFPSIELSPEKSLPTLLHLGVWKEVVTFPEPSLELESPDLTNPILKDIFEPKRNESVTFHSPIFALYYRYKSSFRYPLLPIFKFQNGDLAIGHYPIGTGQFVLFSFPLDSTTNDYLNHPLFVALTYRLLSWITNPVPKTIAYNPASQSYLTIPYVAREQNLRIRPIGQDSLFYIPEQIQRGNQTLLFLSRFHFKPGLYEVVNQNDSLLAYCAINIDSTESYLEFYTKEELENFSSNFHVFQADEVGENIQKLLLASNTFPLWKLCLLFAIICFFGEMIVIRWFT